MPSRDPERVAAWTLASAPTHYWSVWWAWTFLAATCALVVALGVLEVKWRTGMAILYVWVGGFFVASWWLA